MFNARAACIHHYCRSGNIREVLIFANFARRTHLRIQELRENYYFNSSTKEKLKFANYKLREKSQNQKIAKISKHENYKIYSISFLEIIFIIIIIKESII